MAFCSNCGTEVAATAAFCAACGTCIAAAGQSQETTSSIISAQEVSAEWAMMFALIEKAGGPKLPKRRELSSRELSAVSFNMWGFWLGPFYYLGKGMWKKAIVLFALCLPVAVILEIILKSIGVPAYIAYFGVGAIFASRANIDYYKKIVLGDNGWW